MRQGKLVRSLTQCKHLPLKAKKSNICFSKDPIIINKMNTKIESMIMRIVDI